MNKRYITIFIALITLILLFTSLVLYNIKNTLSIEQIIDKISKTTEIVVCKYESKLDEPCTNNDDKFIKTISDKEVINQIIYKIKITNKNESNISDAMGDKYRLFLSDNKYNILAIVDCNPHIRISIGINKYELEIFDYNLFNDILNKE